MKISKFQEGRTRLNLIFLQNFPYRFTHDFTTTEKKIQNLIESDAQNYFNPESVEVLPCTSLEISLNELCFQIIQ